MPRNSNLTNMIETLKRILSDYGEFINSLEDYEDRKKFSLEYLNFLKLINEWARKKE